MGTDRWPNSILHYASLTWGRMVKEELGGSHFQSPWKPQRVRTSFTERLHSPWLISAIHLQSDLDQAEAL